MAALSQNFSANYIELTAEIVAAYVSNNSVPVIALNELLGNVHATFRALAAGGATTSAPGKVEKLTSAQIKKSITPDALISFEDGKSYKTLKRHLRIRSLTPETYRAKYGLPVDYPMVSPRYSAQRSELARSLGLGQQRWRMAKASSGTPEETVSKKAVAAPEKPKKAGRTRNTNSH